MGLGSYDYYESRASHGSWYAIAQACLAHWLDDETATSVRLHVQGAVRYSSANGWGFGFQVDVGRDDRWSSSDCRIDYGNWVGWTDYYETIQKEHAAKTVRVFVNAWGKSVGGGTAAPENPSGGYNVTIPAKTSYQVTYNANQGSGAPSSQTKWHDETLTLSETVPTRANYNFVGWSTSSSATTAEYQPGGVYTGNAALALYAVWEIAFLPPNVNLTAFRTADSSSTTEDLHGGYAYATIAWAADVTNDENNVVTGISASLTEDGQAVTAPTVSGQTSGASGTATARFSASTSSRYELTITVTDGHGVSTVKSALISTVNKALTATYDDDTDEPLITIHNLALDNPLGISYGGTGATTALAARAALGIYMGNGEVLYDNPSHNPGDGMRLSAPYTDYDYLVVVCKDNDGAILAPVIIPNPTLGTVFNVMSTYVGSSNGYFYFKVTAFELTANNGVNDGIGWPKDGNNWRTGQMTIGNSGNSWSYSFNIAPILVVGYKS